MIDLFQMICRKCGVTATGGATQEEAEELAKGEGFIKRPDHWLCGECGGVKKMVTTDMEHYEKEGVKKI